MTRQRTGELWERRAAEHLRSRGLEIVASRYRCRFGELDLVCTDGDAIVVVEVRARGHGSLLEAVESIDAAKQAKLVRAARHLLMANPRWSERPLRFDVVAVDAIDSAEPRFEWIRNAFEAE